MLRISFIFTLDFNLSPDPPSIIPFTTLSFISLYFPAVSTSLEKSCIPFSKSASFMYSGISKSSGLLYIYIYYIYIYYFFFGLIMSFPFSSLMDLSPGMTSKENIFKLSSFLKINEYWGTFCTCRSKESTHLRAWRSSRYNIELIITNINVYFDLWCIRGSCI